MLRRIALATAVLSMSALPALASIERPSMAHQGQWWTNSQGCEYSRAGRPGETVWFLIVNTAQKGCPTYINMVSHGNIYKTHGPKM